MKVVFDENFFDEIDHFDPNFDESVPNPRDRPRATRKSLIAFAMDRCFASM